jgi:hypothetical protein
MARTEESSFSPEIVPEVQKMALHKSYYNKPFGTSFRAFLNGDGLDIRA